MICHATCVKYDSHYLAIAKYTLNRNLQICETFFDSLFLCGENVYNIKTKDIGVLKKA